MIKNTGLTYLATPYTHDDPNIKHKRFEEVNRIAAELMCQGHYIFSPISHAHMIAVNHNLPGDWEFWGEHCQIMLSVSSKMIVFCQDGWKESVGVAKEIDIAVQLGLDIEYMKHKNEV